MVKGYAYLGAEERERIAVFLVQGWSVRAISRELRRNGEEHYCGVTNQQRALRRGRGSPSSHPTAEDRARKWT